MLVKFTARTVAAIPTPPAGRRLECWDTELPGFCLRVSSTGARVYAVRYRIRGSVRQVRRTIGPTPPLTLAEARAQARELLAQATLGQAPQGARGAAATPEPSLRDACMEFLGARDRDLAAWTVYTYRRLIERFLGGPAFSSRPAETVGRPQLEALLQDVEAKHGRSTMIRVGRLLKAVGRWARRRGVLRSNPAEDLEVGHDEARERVLTDEETVLLWNACAEAPPVEGAAVKLLLLLGQRLTETLSMRWVDLQLEAAPFPLWTIPRETRKGQRGQKRGHLLPLPPHVVRLLEELRPVTGTAERVLDGIIPRVSPWLWWERIRDRAVAAGAEHFSRHDLRRTCGTGCARLGAAPYVVSRILGHAVHPGAAAVTAIYDRYDRLPEMVSALTAWAAHVEGLISGRPRGAVVPFGR